MPELSRAMQVKTKIVATVGPASESPEMIERLVRAGVDVFRLNFAHGDAAWHANVVGHIRSACQKAGCVAAILQDLSGPKLRLGELPGGSLLCEVGQRLRFVQHSSGRPLELPTTYAGLVDDLRPGDQVLLADGTVGLRITTKGSGWAEAEVMLGGEVRSRQGINAPGVRLQLDALTEKDLRDLDWAAQHEVDFVGLSFVRRAADVEHLRRELQRRGSHAQVVAKIEKPEALDALDEIIERSDVVMVARGDLGVEIDVARVPIVQKQIIRRCHHFGVPVITATQMLESMRTSNRPTRAEASDVANAILDGTDAVMLSAETATGKFPVETVEVMNRIALETERAPAELHPAVWERPPAHGRATDITLAAVEAACHLAERARASLIVAATHGGHTALGLSKQRRGTLILGLSDQPATVRRLALYWGVLPVLFEKPRVQAEYVAAATEWVRAQGLAKPGDRLVFVFGSRWTGSSFNTMLVHEVG